MQLPKLSLGVPLLILTPCSLAQTTCLPNSLKIPDTVARRKQIIIAHRGASYHLPEHSLEAYRLALELGTDYIEPDIVATKDGELIAMHKADLAYTTNVADVYPDRAWHSPFVNRTSYFSFNFTLQEIKNLTLIQRIPQRNNRYNGIFTIPSLQEILTLLNQWNNVDLFNTLPNQTATDADGFPSLAQQSQSGIYAELKDAVWLKEEANLDLVELMFEHFEKHSDLWKPLQQCWKEFKFDQYVLPPLVLQSFDPASLERFHQTWTSNNKLASKVAEPPYILLADESNCWSDEFWFEVGDSYRSFIAGIGCEKTCLLKEDGRAVKEKAGSFGLVLHPWTERPEQEFMTQGFTNIVDETRHLFCNMGAQGVFSESVSAAILAANLPCDDAKNETGADGTTGSQTKPSSPGVCYETSSEAELYVGLASFAMGVFISGIFFLCLSRKQTRRYGASSVVPSQEDLELEMT